MKVLLDTNIVITYLSGREDKYSKECEQIMRMCAEEKISGYIAFHSLSTIWYVTRKATEAERRGYLRRICKILTISGADNESVMRAIENVNFKDFEDALQDCCADEASADYLITANVKDFNGHSIVRAIAPDEFITLMGK